MNDDDKLRRIVAMLRSWLGSEGKEWIDIVECLSSPEVWTIVGVKRLNLKVVPNLNGADAIASSGEDWALIRVIASVIRDAKSGNGRARMTLAHELAHVVLNHSQAGLARLTGGHADYLSASKRRIESEANSFAAQFLVKPELAAKYKSVDEISKAFGVSKQAAEIRFIEANKKHEKPKVNGLFAELSSFLDAPNGIVVPGIGNVKNTTNPPEIFSVPTTEKPLPLSNAGDNNFVKCPACGEERARPLGGSRFYCEACQGKRDLFQDGDRLGDDSGLANLGDDDPTL